MKKTKKNEKDISIIYISLLTFSSMLLIISGSINNLSLINFSLISVLISSILTLKNSIKKREQKLAKFSAIISSVYILIDIILITLKFL